MNTKNDTEYVYRVVDEIELKLRVFRPSDATDGKARAGIVFFFGGGFVNGSKDQFNGQCEYLASRGLVAITADYRIQSLHNSTPPDSVSDGRAAVSWIRQNAAMLGIDPDRLAAGGGSAGGGVAACCGFSDDGCTEYIPNALVLFNPVVVAAPIDGHETRPAHRIEGYRQRWGCEGIEEISAYHHLSKNYPPTLILHGESDETCPMSTITPVVEKLRSLGVRCELALYAGQGHGFFNPGKGDGSHYYKTLKAADEFLISLGYLGGEPTINLP